MAKKIFLFLLIVEVFGDNIDNFLAEIFKEKPSAESLPKSGEACSMDDGRHGVCTSMFSCQDNINSNEKKLVNIGVRNNCDHYLDTCCSVPSEPENAEKTSEETDNDDQGCGWRNPDGVGGFRMTGDVDGESKFGEFPWVVTVLKISKEKKLLYYNGAGSLIHPAVVLTGAQVVTEDDLSVRAGEWDSKTTKEPLKHQQRNVQSVIVHKNYQKRNMWYAVALLELASPFKMEPHVGVVCLSPAGIRPPSGTQCLAAGWGKTSFNTKQYQNILKKVEVPVMSRKSCQTALRTTRLGGHFKLHRCFTCAGGVHGVDTCKGDGGAPLVCPLPDEQDRYIQTGIVSWGIGCGQNGIPGVYMDVSFLRPWIDMQMRNMGYDDSTYTY